MLPCALQCHCTIRDVDGKSFRLVLSLPNTVDDPVSSVFMQFKTSLLTTNNISSLNDEPSARLVFELDDKHRRGGASKCSDLDPRAQKIAPETLWRDEVADGFVNL